MVDDSARISRSDARIRVLNYRSMAVGADRPVRFLLHVGELDDLVPKRNVELLEDHGHLPGLGAAAVVLESDLLKRHVNGLVRAWA